MVGSSEFVCVCVCVFACVCAYILPSGTDVERNAS